MGQPVKSHKVRFEQFKCVTYTLEEFTLHTSTPKISTLFKDLCSTSGGHFSIKKVIIHQRMDSQGYFFGGKLAECRSFHKRIVVCEWHTFQPIAMQVFTAPILFVKNSHYDNLWIHNSRKRSIEKLPYIFVKVHH